MTVRNRTLNRRGLKQTVKPTAIVLGERRSNGRVTRVNSFLRVMPKGVRTGRVYGIPGNERDENVCSWMDNSLSQPKFIGGHAGKRHGPRPICRFGKTNVESEHPEPSPCYRPKGKATADRDRDHEHERRIKRSHYGSAPESSAGRSATAEGREHIVITHIVRPLKIFVKHQVHCESCDKYRNAT